MRAVLESIYFDVYQSDPSKLSTRTLINAGLVSCGIQHNDWANKSDDFVLGMLRAFRKDDFSPDQPRDETGKWSASGHASDKHVIQAQAVHAQLKAMAGLSEAHAKLAEQSKAYLKNVFKYGIAAQQGNDTASKALRASRRKIEALKEQADKAPKASTGLLEPPPKTETLKPLVPPVVSTPGAHTYTQTDRPAGGSQGGRWYKDEQGNEYFGKEYQGNASRMGSEHAANQIYRAMGIAAPETHIADVGDKKILMSKDVQGKSTKDPQALINAGARNDFVTDAWLGNRDVVGQSFDNMLIGKDGKIVRVDNGSAFTHRAQGGTKEFGKTVTELDSMRDSKYPAGKIFGKLSDADIQKQLGDFSKKYAQERSNIYQILDKSLDKSEATTVKAQLDARADYLKEKFNEGNKPPSAVIQPSVQAKEIKDNLDGYGRQSSAVWRNQLSEAERAAVKNYTGFGYSSINGHLRNNDNIGSVGKANIEHLTNAMNKASLPEALIVHRGIRYDPNFQLPKTGDTFQDKGFVSTSLSPGKSTGFGSDVKFRITVPQGAKAAYISHMGSHKTEAEVLLNRDSKFKVLKVEQNGFNKHIVHMEMIP